MELSLAVKFAAPYLLKKRTTPLREVWPIEDTAELPTQFLIYLLEVGRLLVPNKNFLLPTETRLIGCWIKDNNRVHGDAVAERIKWLVSDVLERVGTHKKSGAWETLYRDPRDGRYWIKTYPQSELQGGGPPALECVSEKDAQDAYDWDYGEIKRKPLCVYETRLIGAKIVEKVGGEAIADDEVSERIVWLVDEVLTKISCKRLDGNIKTLYRDPSDGRYWVRTFSSPDANATSELNCITEDEAKLIFKM